MESKKRRLNEILDHASREVDSWPDWMRNSENKSKMNKDDLQQQNAAHEDEQESKVDPEQ